MRVLITGMGGELGSRVVNLFEADDTVTDIAGIDEYPPRNWITRTRFHRIEPGDRRRAVQVVRDFDPEVLVHLGVYEPNGHLSPTPARLATAASAVSVLGAAPDCPSLRKIVVRSGIEVYGRRRGAPSGPDEDTPVDPTTPWGRSLAHVEEVAAEAGRRSSVPVTLLRFAPIVGPSFPSPLGRYLRLPGVALNPLVQPPFSLLHQEDAAASIMAASRLDPGYDGALNVVGPGTVTAGQAALIGRRVPVPTAGPGWWLAGVTAELLGAPLPPHSRQLLVRGAAADGSRAQNLLGVVPRSTREVLEELYRWEAVEKLSDPPRRVHR